MQINCKTRVKYSGSNADTLAHVQRENGYKSNEWMTFIQARELGYVIKKGEQSTKLVRMIQVFNKKRKKDEDAFFKFSVFNKDQTQLYLK